MGTENGTKNSYINGQFIKKGAKYYNGDFHNNVNVIESVDGFDQCKAGCAFYVGDGITLNDSTIKPASDYSENEWRYFCYAGGAQDVKIFIFTSLEEVDITSEDIIVIPNREFIEGDVPTNADFTVKVKQGDKEFILNSTLYSIENNEKLGKGTNSIEILINGELPVTIETTAIELTDTFSEEENNFIFQSDNKLPSSYKLIVKDVTEELDIETINAQLESEKKIIEIFDIHFADSNNQIIDMGNGRYKIKLKITDEMKKLKNKQVVFIDSENNIKEFFETTEEDDYLLFITSHLSNYGIIGEKQEQKDNTPKTGTVDGINIALTLTVITIVGLVINLKKL